MKTKSNMVATAVMVALTGPAAFSASAAVTYGSISPNYQSGSGTSSVSWSTSTVVTTTTGNVSIQISDVFAGFGHFDPFDSWNGFSTTATIGDVYTGGTYSATLKLSTPGIGNTVMTVLLGIAPGIWETGLIGWNGAENASSISVSHSGVATGPSVLSFDVNWTPDVQQDNGWIVSPHIRGIYDASGGSGDTHFRVTVNSIPETSTALLGAMGALGLLRRRRYPTGGGAQPPLG